MKYGQRGDVIDIHAVVAAVTARLASWSWSSASDRPEHLRASRIDRTGGPGIRLDVALGTKLVLPIEYVPPLSKQAAPHPEEAADLVERALIANWPFRDDLARIGEAIHREAEALAAAGRRHGISVGRTTVELAPRSLWTPAKVQQFTVSLAGVDARLQPAPITARVAVPSQVKAAFIRELALLRRRLLAREQAQSHDGVAWADELTLRAIARVGDGASVRLPSGEGVTPLHPDLLLFWHQGVLRSLCGEPSGFSWSANTVMVAGRWLPETVLDALPGRSLIDVVGHDLATERMIVISARNAGSAVDPRLMIELDIPLVPITHTGEPVPDWGSQSPLDRENRTVS